ncbi:MAG: response regulator transcription factor [Ideonella sp.]|nr:response regulator transcription factor [Ideonella sp.]
MTRATALIAEDEPLLAASLQAELARLWPALDIAASVGHGAAAVEQALALEPDVLFLDIRMPGLSGLEAAQALAEDWPDEPGAVPFPLIVFVTAYDEYALQAFDRAAIDYVLKPVQPERLAQTCARLQSALAQRGGNALAATIEQLRSLLVPPPSAPAAERLNMLPVGVGNEVRMVPVASVIYFEAADKYVRVVTAEREYLIRVSLRELLPQLDPQAFWQIHRGTVVRADAIASALRDEAGKLTLTLADRRERLAVSRLYAQRFKAL